MNKLRLNDLVDRVRRHTESTRIREFVAAAMAARDELAPEEVDWIKWAESYALEIDPTEERLAFPETPKYLSVGMATQRAARIW